LALSIEEARAVFERRRNAWLAEDVTGYLDCWEDGLVIEMPGRSIRGRAAYEQLVRQSLAWGRPRALEIHNLAVDGEVALADWTISVNRRRDGAVVEWRGMSAALLRNGRIVWWREYYEDPKALADAVRG
jgi:ketosteroid isomerase-like protein